MKRRKIEAQKAIPTKRNNKLLKPVGKSRVPAHRGRTFRIDGNSRWMRWGIKVGRKDAHKHSIESEENPKKALNTLWLKRVQKGGAGKLPLSQYEAAAKGYVKGFCNTKKIPVYNWMLLPTNRSVAAIVSLMNEEATISRVINELNRLPFDEIILIINGSKDDTFTKVREQSNAVIVHYDEPIGHDVGRAIGAEMAQSDILLFLDGDFFVPAEQLIPFIRAVEQGMDVALNHVSPFLGLFAQRDSVTMMKQFLNVSLGRPDLGADSLTAVPHALSRKAYETIGNENLLVPPKAQALAILSGLRIGAPAAVNVFAKNKRRRENTGLHNPVARMILGDHAEALGKAMGISGERLSFPDTWRKRKFAGGMTRAGN